MTHRAGPGTIAATRTGCNEGSMGNARDADPTPAGPPPTTRADRIAWTLMGLGTLFAIWTLALAASAPTLGPDMRLLLGYPTFLIWLLPGSLAHLALLVWLVGRLRGGAGLRMLPAILYLTAIATGYLVAGLQLGLTDTATELGRMVTRQWFEPGQVALERAVLGGDPVAARTALQGGADPDGTAPRMGMPLLTVAAWRAEPEMVKVLLEAGADPDQPTAGPLQREDLALARLRPLDAAALASPAVRVALVDRLLAAGAHPERSALLPISCLVGDPALHDRAIARHAPDTADLQGRACLHEAAIGAQVQIARRHLPLATARDAVDRYGMTALDVALVRHHWEVALVYAEAGMRTARSTSIPRTLAEPDAGPALARLRRLLEARAEDSGAGVSPAPLR